MNDMTELTDAVKRLSEAVSALESTLAEERAATAAALTEAEDATRVYRRRIGGLRVRLDKNLHRLVAEIDKAGCDGLQITGFEIGYRIRGGG